MAISRAQMGSQLTGNRVKKQPAVGLYLPETTLKTLQPCALLKTLTMVAFLKWKRVAAHLV
jgi:hypothetical protein